MRGAHRAFVFGAESRYRLPALALLAGNGLPDVAATSAAVATGGWDRCCRPSCGRLRRGLLRVDFAAVPCPGRPTTEKGVGDEACVEGGAGTSASAWPRNAPEGPSTAESGLI